MNAGPMPSCLSTCWVYSRGLVKPNLWLHAFVMVRGGVTCRGVTSALRFLPRAYHAGDTRATGVGGGTGGPGTMSGRFVARRLSPARQTTSLSLSYDGSRWWMLFLPHAGAGRTGLPKRRQPVPEVAAGVGPQREKPPPVRSKKVLPLPSPP